MGLPVLEHGTEVEKDDVILPNRQIWRILIVWSQRVAPGAHDAFVPIARDPVHAPGKRVDLVIYLAFFRPWPNQALRFDLDEQRMGLCLSIQQPGD
jgi:hypothetical protein